MQFGIIDHAAAAMLSHDLKEADFRHSIGDDKSARQLIADVERIREIDFEVRRVQAFGLGLLSPTKGV